MLRKITPVGKVSVSEFQTIIALCTYQTRGYVLRTLHTRPLAKQRAI